jgi:DNA-binding GntR family transcriptional regulator
LRKGSALLRPDLAPVGPPSRRPDKQSSWRTGGRKAVLDNRKRHRKLPIVDIRLMVLSDRARSGSNEAAWKVKSDEEHHEKAVAERRSSKSMSAESLPLGRSVMLTNVTGSGDASKLTGTVVAESLTDKVLNVLVEAIERGELPPGSRIREANLARQLGISRGPLREALARLAGRKLLEYTPNVGMRVTTMSLDDIIEIFQVREALEGMACRLATKFLSDAELERLNELLDTHREEDELKSGTAYYQLSGDLDFHYQIALGSRNKRLVASLCDDLYHFIRIYRFRSSAKPGRALLALKEHQAILAAMRARDEDLAEALMRQHIRAAIENLKVELEGEDPSTAE